MFAYKIENKKIVGVLINPTEIPSGYVTSDLELDATKFEYDNGQFVAKTVEATTTVESDTTVAIETEEQIIAKLLPYRNILLRESDWTQLNDAPITPEVKEAYKEWRQQLRDFPENARKLGYKLPSKP